MFREMRRFKQRLNDEEALDILRNGKTAVFGVTGDEGYPYTVPLNYVYANGKIYFHCAKEGHKIDAVKRNPKVSMCVIEKDDVIAQKLTTAFRSVIIFGKAHILEVPEEIFDAARMLGLKYSSDEDFIHDEIHSEMDRLCCVEIEIEHITGKEGIELTRARRENQERGVL